jgi:hypothetical protein
MPKYFSQYHLQPDISVFDIIHDVNYSYNQLYSSTNAHNKIYIIHKS